MSGRAATGGSGNAGAKAGGTSGNGGGGTGGVAGAKAGGASGNGGGGSGAGGVAAGAGGGTAAAGSSSGSMSYSTSFAATESPLRDGSIWKQGASDGLDWTDVNAKGGLGFGTMPINSPTFNDSIACLSGFPPDQTASATVSTSAAPVGDREFEVLLRWTISAHVAHGYECNYAWNGDYAQVVWWRGPLGGFVQLENHDKPSPGAIQSGDILTAQIVGSMLTFKHTRGATVTTLITTDTSTNQEAPAWKTGNPGIGFWRAGTTQPPWAYSHFSASAL